LTELATNFLLACYRARFRTATVLAYIITFAVYQLGSLVMAL
jgi:hypothetical protein